MPKVNFNVHAYTARLIGRENVSKLEGAVLELVKNTYDADASHCILYYENSTKNLYIADNGQGMTKDIIEEHWMTIGNSSKVINYRSEKGRIQTGAKGIGRFALDRISDECKMFTETKGSKIEWNVNWSDFESGSRITEIYAELDEVDYEINDFVKDIKNQQIRELFSREFKNTGTIFKLSALREEWSLDLVERIKNNLATLIPPEIENIFKVYFFTENTSIEEARVSLNDGLFSYDYKLQFEASSDGKVVIKIHRDEFDFNDNLEQIIREAGFSSKDKEYFSGTPIIQYKTLHELMPSKNLSFINNIGEFSGVLYFSKLSATRIDKEKYYYKDFSGRMDYKETFGGIKMYRDNFRIRPYGEPKTSNYDWLLLSNRKAKSPAAIASNGQWRVNSDQMLGSIYISRTNISMPDQANREGIVETPEFRNFREILLGIIKLFEEDRQYVMRLLNKYHEKTHYTAQYEHEIFTKANHDEKNQKKENNDDNQSKENKPGSQFIPQLIEATKAKTVIQDKENIIRDLEDENRLLRALATTGIVTNTYIHEIKDSTHKLSMKIVMAKEALELDDDKNEAIGYINEASEIKNSFNSWFKVTIESVRRDKRTMKEIDLQQLLQGLVSSWNDVASNKGIRVNLSIEEIKFKCFPYELEILFNNLITNSITSFESINVKNKEINIKVYQSSSSVMIEYSDTGAGLSAGYKNNPREILKPHETDKFNELGEKIGTGMGMWIIDKTVSEYNGEVDLSQNISSQTGFFIKIRLKGKVKTL
ncbi:sensor histidine kinase [Pullulanibacillus sp. KACC 23026]|uniref:sensor histidine kinase n=1 Tax=Pullulanibacillus sp. KACC 23026 TaxID=3028315 RepID=UPI0023AEB038|nr:sensor histidine kinase [Pullulanibacillus sp. KACC 23026]WEG12603.1 sensor histidine kinase [Pullulanibacillus sp. KACC 23026]